LTGEAMNGLGFLYLQQRKYSQAQPLLEKAFHIWENSGGFEAYAAVALNNLALLARLQGAFEKAESQYKQASDLEEKAFGRDHPRGRQGRVGGGGPVPVQEKNTRGGRKFKNGRGSYGRRQSAHRMRWRSKRGKSGPTWSADECSSHLWRGDPGRCRNGSGQAI